MSIFGHLFCRPKIVSKRMLNFFLPSALFEGEWEEGYTDHFKSNGKFEKKNSNHIENRLESFTNSTVKNS